jgi:hypothetical protein
MLSLANSKGDHSKLTARVAESLQPKSSDIEKNMLRLPLNRHAPR